MCKCNFCDKSFASKVSAEIKYHLYHSHELHDDKEMEEWKNYTNDLIWQYFSKQDGYTACCKNCNKLIKHGYKKSCLIRHLYRFHEHIIKAKREIIEQTWLSRHIIFEDWRVICKEQNCSYRRHIFQKVDILKSHLDKRHNINRYSGCEERTEDSEAEGMKQQTVDKTNCAGPSSHHDNTQKQSLGSQESLQGYQHNGQVSESHKIWKPYI